MGIIAGGLRNLGRVKQSGLDISANYSFDTGIGRVSAGGAFSKLLKLKRSLLPTSPLFDALDTFGNQVSSRGRANLGLNHGPFSANLFMNYVGSYLNNATITVNGVKYPDTRIPSWVTFDAGLSYTGPQGSGPLDGIRVSVNVQNLAGKDPPVVLSGTNAVDLNNHNVFGRVWQFEITKKF